MRIACLPVAALALSTAAMAQTFLKPGLYEFTTIVTDVSGVPPMIAAQMKSQRNSMQRCLTQDAAAKGTRQWMEETNPGCRFSRFAVTGNHVDMTMACTGPGGARSLAASGDVTPTGYAETGTMKYASGPMTMQFVRTFKRIGNCKQAAVGPERRMPLFTRAVLEHRVETRQNRVMRAILLASPLLLAALPAQAREAPSPARLKATVTKLAGFGTRHSLSSTTDPARGIGAARDWVAGEFRAIGSACGGCLTVERISRRFVGPRAPDGVVIEDVLGIQPGTDPNRYVIVGGHVDSMPSDVMDATADAPGANDDASGVAVVLEAARILSKQKFAATIIYAVFSGEEQGLWGGTLLAQTAKARGWQVDAMLNNDIVGNAVGQGGLKVADRVRVFSEGIRADESLAEAMERRAIGGEDDGPSRALAKAIAGVADTLPGKFAAFVDRRPDRFGRGGDHEPFLAEGYPAVRFTSAVENWDRQHQNVRTENGRPYGDLPEAMDFDYLGHVAAINIATLARLAAAPAAPAGVTIAGALSRDTTVQWKPVPGAVAYKVRWRRTDRQDWTDTRSIAGATSTVLKEVPVDDNFVGVSAISADGAESLVTFAGRAPRRQTPRDARNDMIV